MIYSNLTDRFKDAPWLPQKEIPCIIGGAGGIGGWLALLLSRATFTVSIFDDDTFEEHNMSGQMVMTEHIGKSKVDTVKDIVDALKNSGKEKIEINPAVYAADSFDMPKDSRVDIFEKISAEYLKKIRKK